MQRWLPAGASEAPAASRRDSSQLQHWVEEQTSSLRLQGEYCQRELQDFVAAASLSDAGERCRLARRAARELHQLQACCAHLAASAVDGLAAAGCAAASGAVLRSTDLAAKARLLQRGCTAAAEALALPAGVGELAAAYDTIAGRVEEQYVALVKSVEMMEHQSLVFAVASLYSKPISTVAGLLPKVLCSVLAWVAEHDQREALHRIAASLLLLAGVWTCELMVPQGLRAPQQGAVGPDVTRSSLFQLQALYSARDVLEERSEGKARLLLQTFLRDRAVLCHSELVDTLSGLMAQRPGVPLCEPFPTAGSLLASTAVGAALREAGADSLLVHRPLAFAWLAALLCSAGPCWPAGAVVYLESIVVSQPGHLPPAASLLDGSTPLELRILHQPAARRQSEHDGVNLLLIAGSGDGMVVCQLVTVGHASPAAQRYLDAAVRHLAAQNVHVRAPDPLCLDLEALAAGAAGGQPVDDQQAQDLAVCGLVAQVMLSTWWPAAANDRQRGSAAGSGTSSSGITDVAAAAAQQLCEQARALYSGLVSGLRHLAFNPRLKLLQRVSHAALGDKPRAPELCDAVCQQLDLALDAWASGGAAGRCSRRARLEQLCGASRILSSLDAVCALRGLMQEHADGDAAFAAARGLATRMRKMLVGFTHAAEAAASRAADAQLEYKHAITVTQAVMSAYQAVLRRGLVIDAANGNIHSRLTAQQLAVCERQLREAASDLGLSQSSQDNTLGLARLLAEEEMQALLLNASRDGAEAGASMGGAPRGGAGDGMDDTDGGSGVQRTTDPRALRRRHLEQRVSDGVQKLQGLLQRARRLCPVPSNLLAEGLKLLSALRAVDAGKCDALHLEELLYGVPRVLSSLEAYEAKLQAGDPLLGKVCGVANVAV